MSELILLNNDEKRDYFNCSISGRSSEQNWLDQTTFPPPENGGFKGQYSYKRARGKINARLTFMDWLWRSYESSAYLTTLTFSDRISNEERHSAKNKFLDNFRKRRFPLLWITEPHNDREDNEETSNVCGRKGLVHYHILSIHPTQWKYKKRNGMGRFSITEWSLRYCGSNNGLDVKKIDKTLFYLSCYFRKTPDVFTLNKRLWGCQRIPTDTRLEGDISNYAPSMSVLPNSNNFYVNDKEKLFRSLYLGSELSEMFTKKRLKK